MSIQRGELIRQSDVTWKTVSIGELIRGNDVIPNQSPGILITQSNFTGFNYNFGQFDFFKDGSCLQYYPLDGNQNDLGGRYNQSLIQNITWDTVIKSYGSASQYFNGSSSRIRLMTFDTLYSLVAGVSKSWTLSLFFYVLPMSQNSIQTISDFGWSEHNVIQDNEQAGHLIQISTGSNNNYFVKIVYHSNHLTSRYTSISYPISPNTWYHIVISYNGNTKTQNVYLNKNKIFNNIEWDNWWATFDSEPWMLGQYVYSDGPGEGNNPTSFFKGYIDNIRLFNRQITDTEVLGLYYESYLS